MFLEEMFVLASIILSVIAIIRSQLIVQQLHNLRSDWKRFLSAQEQARSSQPASPDSLASPSNSLPIQTDLAASQALLRNSDAAVARAESPVNAGVTPIPTAASSKLPPVLVDAEVVWPEDQVAVESSGSMPTAEQAMPTAKTTDVPLTSRKSRSSNLGGLDADVDGSRARRGISLEERLGAKLPVWLGAIAILLAGIFLMAFAVKQGWFTPRLRVYSASLVSVILIVAGCVLRRSYANLGQGLAAAGVGIQFAVVLAVSTIFREEFSWINPWISLAALVAIAALAVVLSLYLGPMVAIIGLIGGFATPSLLQLDGRHTAPLFGCLLVQQVGSTVMGRREGLWFFPLLALIAVQLYAGVWVWWFWDPLQAPLLGGVLLVAVACFCLAMPASVAASASEGTPQKTPFRQEAESAWWAVLPALILSAILVARSDLSWVNLGLHAALLAGIIVFARFRENFFVLYPCAAAISILSLLVQVVLSPAMSNGLLDDRVVVAMIVFAVILGLGTLWAVQRSHKADRWSLVTVCGLIALGVLPHLGPIVQPFPTVRTWLAIGGAAWCGLLATLINYSRWRIPAKGDLATAAVLVGFCSLVLIATLLGMRVNPVSHYWFAVSVSCLVLLMAILTPLWRLDCASPIQFALGALLLLSLLNPWTLGETLTPRLYWNQAIWGFGAGIIALVAGGWILHSDASSTRKGSSGQTTVPQLYFSAASILLACLLCTLVRSGFSQYRESSPTTLWLELSADVIAIALVGLLLTVIANIRSSDWARKLSAAFLVVALAATLGLTGLVFGPLFQPIDVGERFLINAMAFAYALPILIVGTALWLQRGSASALRNVAAACLCLTLAMFLFLQVRHGFWRHPGEMMLAGRSSFHVCEIPTYALILGIISGVTDVLNRRQQSQPIRQAATGLALGFGVLVFLLITSFNPLLWTRDVGAAPIINWLLYIFGTPAVVAAWLALRFRAIQPTWSTTSGILSLLLLWLLVTAEVRQFFVGSKLPGPAPTQTEWYSYSAAWIVLSIVLLVFGVVYRNKLLRWASLVLMLASVAKVFLFDTRELGDLWRVASYFGLGISLMVVAFVYQRFVFRESRGRIGELP